jgi:ribonucleotide monophosphatase NagD (HAD superfamily)
VRCIYTSAYAAAAHLRAARFEQTAFLVANEGLELELAAAGIRTAGGARYPVLRADGPAARLPSEDEAHSVELDPNVGCVITAWDGNFTCALLLFASLLHICARMRSPYTRIICAHSAGMQS